MQHLNLNPNRNEITPNGIVISISNLGLFYSCKILFELVVLHYQLISNFLCNCVEFAKLLIYRTIFFLIFKVYTSIIKFLAPAMIPGLLQCSALFLQ